MNRFWLKMLLMVLLAGTFSFATADDKAARKDTAARIAAMKAELDAVKAAKSKNGQPEEIGLMDLTKAEVVLPAVLALVDDDFAEYGIRREPLTAEIKANPEKFRQKVPELWRLPRFLLLTPEMEKSFGDQVEKEITDQNETVQNSKVQARLNAVAAKIIAQLPVKPPLRVLLLKSEEVNAFSLPNGTVMVCTAMYERLQSDDELAVILAHEYAHYAARHSNEKVTKMVFAAAGRILAEDKSNRLDNEGKKWKALLTASSYLAGSVLIFRRPYDRRMEKEADILGLRYLARAGYNPQTAITMWQRIFGNADGFWAQYLSTHPTDAKRLKYMQKECDKIKKNGGSANAKEPPERAETAE